jgi:hypothetical protein
MGCTKCHKAEELQAKAGKKDEASIRQLILDPYAGVTANPKPVHQGFDQEFTIKNFNDVMAYVAGTKPEAGAH